MTEHPTDTSGVDTARPQVSVRGTGVARAAVDRVELVLGVEVLRADAGAAFQAAAGTATALLAILADRGVDSRHVRTAQLRLGPNRVYTNGEERLVGYIAGQNLYASLSGLATLGPMLTEIATSGLEGVRIDQVSLVASDSVVAAEQARETAMADARSRADQYAALVGRSVGQVLEISEVTADQPPHLMRQSKAMSADMPVAPGEEAVTATVSVRYALV